jgi:hypothetical protein
MVTTFGPYELESFQVWTHELEESAATDSSVSREIATGESKA